MELDNLKTTIEAKALELQNQVNKFEDDMKALLETAKNNEIMKELRSLGNRLSAIENRLPPVEED